MILLKQLKFSPITLLLIFFSIVSINNSYAVEVGESYGGGTVFCISDTEDTTKCKTEGSGDYGLVMANEDQANVDLNPQYGGVLWSSVDYKIGPSVQSKDNGATNTAAIIAAYLKNKSVDHKAALLCHNYRIEKEGDWYLPAINELKKMHLFASKNNLIGKDCSGSKAGGIQCLIGSYEIEREEYNLYWSSSEDPDSDSHAWAQFFHDGYSDYHNKAYNHFGVRAIRAFKNPPG